MSSYPNMLTPPSSSEDSPAPLYFIASPDSSSFHDPINYGIHMYPNIPQQIVVNPSELMENLPRASLQIIEQPTDRFRFRYKSEMAGTHGSLTGYNSCKSRKQTYPAVQLKNCHGPAIIRCSIYQLNEKGNDMKPHAHRLIMKRGKEEHDDPHNIEVGLEDEYKAVFHGMGIIHTAKKNIVTELEKKKTHLLKESIARIEGKFRELTTKERVEIKGLAESESKSINLNIVCLRFDAFIKQHDILYPICEPVYSHGINNLKSALTGDLKIVRLDHVVCEAKGEKQVFILVERVTKKNIKIRFYETDDEDQVIWEADGKFNDLDVHHQYAIVFRTPPYRDQNITRPVSIFIELVRPSDNARSEPRDFRYIPNRERIKPGQKRARYDYSSSNYNSSNLGSDEIPVVVNQMEISNNIPSSFPSIPEEMLRAMKDINSEEFKSYFNDNGADFISFLDTDAPKDLNKKGLNSGYNMDTVKLPPLIKIEVSREEQNSVIRFLDELKGFMNTKPNQQRADRMLNHHLGEDKKTNAFHISICQNNMEAAIFILNILVRYKRLDLINIMNSESQTYLHLAVLSHNVIMVRQLLINKAKVAVQDNDLNTILHIAIKCHAPVEILTMLLCNREYETVGEYLNDLNIDGYSALMLAIECRNLTALKLLNMKKADINIMHAKDGFVPIRLAIEKRYIEGIKFLLSLPCVDPTIKDFRGISPLNAAMQKENEVDLINIVQDYMKKHNISIDVKEEYDSEDNMDMEDDYIDIKPQISLEELEKLYGKVSNFTPQCLHDVSDILNTSGKWEDLADLLDIKHIVSSGIISDSNVSKSLLTFAVETNNDSLWIIRNFLENLDEARAVEIMDRMIQDNIF